MLNPIPNGRIHFIWAGKPGATRARRSDEIGPGPFRGVACVLTLARRDKAKDQMLKLCGKCQVPFIVENADSGMQHFVRSSQPS